jgi:hypothetical protein
VFGRFADKSSNTGVLASAIALLVISSRYPQPSNMIRANVVLVCAMINLEIGYYKKE